MMGDLSTRGSCTRQKASLSNWKERLEVTPDEVESLRRYPVALMVRIVYPFSIFKMGIERNVGICTTKKGNLSSRMISFIQST